jgi:hypothetical protein
MPRGDLLPRTVEAGEAPPLQVSVPGVPFGTRHRFRLGIRFAFAKGLLGVIRSSLPSRDV